MYKNPTLIMIKYTDPSPRRIGDAWHVEFAGYPQGNGKGLQHLHAWSMPFDTEEEAFAWIAKGTKVVVAGAKP